MTPPSRRPPITATAAALRGYQTPPSRVNLADGNAHRVTESMTAMARAVLPEFPAANAGASSWASRFGAILRLSVLLALLPAQLLVGAALAYHFAFADRIYPGVAVADLNLTGYTREEATQRLREYVSSVGNRPLILRFEEQHIQTTLGDMGLTVPEMDLGRAADQAWQVARGGHPGAAESPTVTTQSDGVTRWLRAQVTLHRYGERLALPLITNPETGRQTLAQMARRIDRPAINAEVRVIRAGVAYEPQLTPAQPGIQLDIEATLALFHERFQQAVGSGTYPDTLDLVVHAVEPQVADVGAVYEVVTQVLASPLIFIAPDGQPWQIESAALLDTLEQPAGQDTVVTTVEFDETKIRDLVTAAVGSVGEKPQNARLVIAGDWLAIEPSVSGWQVDLEAAVQLALEHLTSAERELALPVKEQAPAVDDQDLIALRDWTNLQLTLPPTLEYNGHRWTLRPHDILGFLSIPDTSALEAEDVLAGTAEISLDQARVRRFVMDWVLPWTGLDPAHAGMDAGLEVHESRVVIRPSRSGQTIDVESVIAGLTAAFHSTNPAARRVAVDVITYSPRGTEANLVAPRDAANRLISSPIVLRSPLGEEENTVISVDQLISMLQLPLVPGEMATLARGSLVALVQELAKQIEASVQFTSGSGPALSPAIVDVEHTVDAILQHAHSPDRIVDIIFVWETETVE
jgi:vancomycin resistance protein YoaR